jgi:Flp pilus assembly protein CpaB
MFSRLSLGHVIMIVAGLAAFLLVFSLLRSRDETFLIAVANVQLRAGTSVTEDAFDFAEVGAADRSVLGTFLSPEVAQTAVEEGWAVTRTVPPGDPVRMSDFRTEPNASDFRAMSIPIERGHAVAGVLQAGDIIDVIVVRKGVAGYVASGVEVLDVDGAASQFGGGFSVTVAVDAPTSLRVASALRDGAIELVRATGAAAADPEDSYDPLSVDPDQG